MAAPDSFPVGQAPWDKPETADSFPVGQAPWDTQASPSTEKVVDEMHPALQSLKGFATRAVYKNLGADPVASFNYLQKQFPEMEWKLKNGEPVARSRGETEYRKLDPGGMPEWSDATDVLYDVGAGVAQGAATAAGGIAGGIMASPTVIGAPVGAGFGASVASAGTGAALEAARQSIGNLMGIDQGVSAKDVGTSAAIGAVSPMLFGTGAGINQAAGALEKYGLGQGAQKAAEDLALAQRGVLGRGYDAAAGYVGPKVGELVSGVPESMIKTASKMLPVIKSADRSSEVTAEPLREAAVQVPKILKQRTRELGGRLDELRALIDKPLVEGGEVAGSIPSQSLVKPFTDTYEKLVKSSSGTAAQKKDIENVKKLFDAELDNLPEMMAAEKADALEKRFKDLAQTYGMKYGKTGSTTSALDGSSAYDGKIASAFEQARLNIRKSTADRLAQLDQQAADTYGEIKDSYGTLKKMAELHQGDFKNARSVQAFLRRAVSDDVTHANLKDIQKATGYDLEDVAQQNKALDMFSKPSSDMRSLGGATSTTKTVPLSIGAGLLGYGIGQESGGEYSPYYMGALGAALGSRVGSPAAIRKYMEMNAAARALPQAPGFKALPYTLMNMADDKGRK